MNRRTFIAATASTLGVVGMFAWAAVPEDDHHGMRYQLWKRGWFPIRPGFKNAFMADGQRDSMVLGRDRGKLSRSFSPLTSGRKNAAYWNGVYEQFRADDEFVWLWDSNWLVVLRGGKAIHLRYLKG